MTDRCQQCGCVRGQHCDLDEPGLDHSAACDLMHHEFKPSQNEIARLEARVRELEQALVDWRYELLSAIHDDGEETINIHTAVAKLDAILPASPSEDR